MGTVLHDVSFDVLKGETFGLIGLNGVGKTTLIKILLGLLDTDQGSAKIFSKDTSDLTSKSKLAYLPERFEPPIFLNGIEFIEFSLKLYNQPFDRDTALKAAERLALDPKALDRRVDTYSKGMRQKLGLLATFLTKCPLIILDEPMSGLDPRARVFVKEEILQLRKSGVTIFLSSHILADMDEICDRIGIIHDGNLLFTGTPKEIKKTTKQDYLERAFLKTIDAYDKTNKKVA